MECRKGWAGPTPAAGCHVMQPLHPPGWMPLGVQPPVSIFPYCVPVQNKKNTPERLELMKYNKYLRKMTLHREIK